MTVLKSHWKSAFSEILSSTSGTNIQVMVDLIKWPEKQKDSLDIRTAIGQALSMQGKDLSTKKRWWPSSDEEQDFDRKKHSGPAQRSTTMLWLTGQKSTANTVMPLSQGPQSRSAENVVFIFASQERSIP